MSESTAIFADLGLPATGPLKSILPQTVVGHCLTNLLLSVHHKWTMLNDGLIEGLTSYQYEVELLRPCVPGLNVVPRSQNQSVVWSTLCPRGPSSKLPRSSQDINEPIPTCIQREGGVGG
jgi:hypothetical protein